MGSVLACVFLPLEVPGDLEGILGFCRGGALCRILETGQSVLKMLMLIRWLGTGQGGTQGVSEGPRGMLPR